MNVDKKQNDACLFQHHEQILNLANLSLRLVPSNAPWLRSLTKTFCSIFTLVASQMSIHPRPNYISILEGSDMLQVASHRLYRSFKTIMHAALKVVVLFWNGLMVTRLFAETTFPRVLLGFVC